jgi:hypothetical protein
MGIPGPDGGAKQQGGGGGGGRPPDRIIPFGKYQLLERVSVGGMAEVFKAKSFGIEGFEKILAVKRILPTMAEDGDFIEMFIDEAKIAGQLSHANICPIYELGKVGDAHYIAMEFVWGKDLLQLMNRFRKMRKHMPPAMVAWIAAKVCEGLDYAHRKRDRNGNPMNIIHRDMSPQNVLVSYEGQIKIIDFGIAKAASRTTKTQAGVLKGKFGYMSPEQVRGLPVDARSDLFAVGTCMHEMSTGERLFLGESDFTTLEKVRNAEVPPPSRGLADYPPELERIIMKALTLDVADRWSSAAEMQEALQRFLATQKPPYGTSKLAAWMKTAFAAELAAEKERMQAYQTAARSAPASATPPAPAAAAGGAPTRAPRPRMPTMLGVGAPAPAPAAAPTVAPPLRRPPAPKPVAPNETAQLDTADLGAFGDDMDDLAGEKTMVGASPFDDDASDSLDLPEQPTQIFFSAEDAPSDEPATTTRAPSASGAAGVEVSHADLYGAAATPAAPPQRTFPPPMAAASRPAPSAPVFSAPPVAAMPGNGLQPPLPATFPSPASAPPQAGNFPASPPQHAHSGSPPFDPQQPLPGVVPLPTPASPAAFAPAPASAARPASTQGGGRGQLVGIALAAVLLIAAGAGIAVLIFGRPSGGTVEVQTVPAVPGDIYVDGTLLGQAPKRLEPVPPGEHIIEIRAAGYAPAQRRVTVTAGNTTMMEIAMVPSATPPASPTALALGAAPTPPGVVAAPPPGIVPAAPAALGVVSPLPGLAPPAPTEPAPAPEALPPAPAAAAAAVLPAPAPVAPAPAAIAAAPAPARVVAPPAAPPPTPAPPAPAPTRSAPVREPAPARSAPVREPAPTRSDPAREPAPARSAPARTSASEAPAASSARGSGTLAISTQPWARVFLDGRDTRRDTPVRDLRARAGRHTIGLRKPDGTMVEFEVEVVADETTTIIRRL